MCDDVVTDYAERGYAERGVVVLHGVYRLGGFIGNQRFVSG